MTLRNISLGMLFSAFIVFSLFAMPKEENPVTLLVGTIDPVAGKAGDTVNVVVPIKVTPGFHVNANPPSSDLYIPLEVMLDTSAFRPLATRYPKSHVFRLDGYDEELWVYDGDIQVTLPVVIPDGAKLGEQYVKGTVDYQACNNELCFLPETRPIKVRIVVR